MKRKEDPPGVSGVQSRAALWQAPEQGKAALKAAGWTSGLRAHRALATGETCSRLMMAGRWLALRGTQVTQVPGWFCVLLVLGGLRVLAPPHILSPLARLCQAFLLLKHVQPLTLAAFHTVTVSRASTQCIRNTLEWKVHWITRWGRDLASGSNTATR